MLTYFRYSWCSLFRSSNRRNQKCKKFWFLQILCESFMWTPEGKMNCSTLQCVFASIGICSFQQQFKSSITQCKMTPAHWKGRQIQEMCCILSTYLNVCALQGGGDHGNWLSLPGLAINPLHDSQPHNIPSLFKSLSQQLFSIFLFVVQSAS